MKPPDGTYEFEEGILTALTQLQPDRLRQVEHVLRQATNREIAPEEAAEEITIVAPELASLLARLPADKTALVWVQTLLAAITVILAWMALHHDTLSGADHRGVERDMRTAIEQAHAPAMAAPLPTQSIPQPPRPAAERGATARHTPPSRKKRPPKTYGKSKRKKNR